MAQRPAGQTGTTNKQTFLRILPRPGGGGVQVPANTKVIVQKTHERQPYYGCVVRGLKTRNGNNVTKRGWIHMDDVTLDAPATAASTEVSTESIEETGE